MHGVAALLSLQDAEMSVYLDWLVPVVVLVGFGVLILAVLALVVLLYLGPKRFIDPLTRELRDLAGVLEVFAEQTNTRLERVEREVGLSRSSKA